MGKRKYSPECYDNKLALKISLSMWLGIIYLLLPPIIYVASLGVRNRAASDFLKQLLYSNDTYLLFAILSTVPIVILLYAWLSRSHDSPPYVRTIWHNGKSIICFTASIQLIILLLPQIGREKFYIDDTTMVRIGILITVISYILVSTRVKDTLKDFPTYKPKEKTVHLK